MDSQVSQAQKYQRGLFPVLPSLCFKGSFEKDKENLFLPPPQYEFSGLIA